VNGSLFIFCCVLKNLDLPQAWVSLFGFAAALASFRSGWKATALPPAGSSTTPSSLVESEAGDASDKPQDSTTDAGYNAQ
jgi:hypothetical protein